MFVIKGSLGDHVEEAGCFGSCYCCGAWLATDRDSLKKVDRQLNGHHNNDNHDFYGLSMFAATSSFMESFNMPAIGETK